MNDAGRMDYSIAFDEPAKIPDGRGGVIQGWAEIGREYAAFRYLRGGESVQASRLAGRQPVVITVYDNSRTRELTTACRVRDLRSADVFNIRAIIPTDDRQFFEITAEKGVAV